MNFGTFFICKRGLFTFRVLGFGMFACNRHTFPMYDSQAARLWLVPITPNWHFCFVAPWL